MDYAKTLKGVAAQHVNTDQWDQAAGKIEETRDILGDLLQVNSLLPLSYLYTFRYYSFPFLLSILKAFCLN